MDLKTLTPDPEDDSREVFFATEKSSIPDAVARVPFVILTPAPNWTPLETEIFRYRTDDRQTILYARYRDLDQPYHPWSVITVHQGATPLDDQSDFTARSRRVEGEEGGYLFSVMVRPDGQRVGFRSIEFVRHGTFVTIYFRRFKVPQMVAFVDSMMPYDPTRETEGVDLDPDRPY